MLFAKELLLPAHTASAGNYNPKLLQQAIQFLLKDQDNTVSKSEKIYISRQKETARKVINEEEIIACLIEEGFTILECEDFSFEEQVSIFSHARVLVSIHGAGLTNLVFMPTGSCVLELRKEEEPEMYNCYFSLASVFDQRYFYQGCKSDSNLSATLANIYVNLNKLKENLDLIMAT